MLCNALAYQGQIYLVALNNILLLIGSGGTYKPVPVKSSIAEYYQHQNANHD